MAKLFVTLSREEAENIAPAEPIDAGKASELANDAAEVEKVSKDIQETEDGIEDGFEALEDLQEAENMAAASAGEEPVDVITGEPVVEAEDAECGSETPGVTEPTPTGTEEAVAAPAPEVAAAVATECLRQVKKRLGMDSEGIQVSFESLDSRSPISSLQLAREGIGDTAKKIWDAIKAMFKKIWDKIKELWGKFTGFFKKKVEVVEQIAEEIKEIEQGSDDSAGNAGNPVKLPQTYKFDDADKREIAELCAICIGKNADAMENLELMSKKIKGNANAIKASAAGVASIPAKAEQKKLNEIVIETLENIRKSYSIDMSINGISNDTDLNKSDIVIVTDAFNGDVIFAAKEGKNANNKSEVQKHGFKTAKVDGFKDNAAISRLMGTINVLDSSTYSRLVEICKTAGLKDYPAFCSESNKAFSGAEKALKDLEAKYNKIRKKDDDKVESTSSIDTGLTDTYGAMVRPDVANSTQLGNFINKLLSENGGLRSMTEVRGLFTAIEKWGTKTVNAAKNKKKNS